jgi:hypothetical protein
MKAAMPLPPAPLQRLLRISTPPQQQQQQPTMLFEPFCDILLRCETRRGSACRL